MNKWWVVFSGKSLGIFNTWDECKYQVKGYSGAKYKSYSNYEDAHKDWNKFCINAKVKQNEAYVKKHTL